MYPTNAHSPYSTGSPVPSSSEYRVNDRFIHASDHVEYPPEMDDWTTSPEQYGDRADPGKQLHRKGTRGAWSPEEDRLLIEAVRTYGSKWSLVAGVVKTRSSTQCARRWSDTLDPRIDKSPWTPEQDQILLQAVAQHGRTWASIAKAYFPGRTGLALKNRYTVIGKPRAGSTSPVDSYMQSELSRGSPTSMGMHYPETPWDPTINNQYSYPQTWPSDRDQTMQRLSANSRHWTGDTSVDGLGVIQTPQVYPYDPMNPSTRPGVQYPSDWRT